MEIHLFRKYGYSFCRQGVLGYIWAEKDETSGKGFSPPDAMKNIHDSWEEAEMSTLRVWKKGIQPSWIMEGLRTSTEDVPSDMIQTAGEPESEVKLECGTVLP